MLPGSQSVAVGQLRAPIPKPSPLIRSTRRKRKSSLAPRKLAPTIRSMQVAACYHFTTMPPTFGRQPLGEGDLSLSSSVKRRDFHVKAIRSPLRPSLNPVTNAQLVPTCPSTAPNHKIPFCCSTLRLTQVSSTAGGVPLQHHPTNLHIRTTATSPERTDLWTGSAVTLPQPVDAGLQEPAPLPIAA